MKLRLLSILLVCLMTTGVFAASFTWTSTTGGEFSTTTNWSANPYASNLVGDEYRIYYNAMPAAVSISTNAGALPGRIRLSGGGPTDPTPAKINVSTGGSIKIAEFRVGDGGISGTSGGVGQVTQTGGIVTMIASSSGTSFSRNLTIGRGGNSGPVAKGQYIISGGTLNYADTDMFGDPVSFNDAKLLVGTGSNGTTLTEGTFTVVGGTATIKMKELLVGYDGSRTGHKGTMEFQIVNGAVSAVQLTKTVSLNTLGAGATANLLVSLTSGTPLSAILLIENTSTTGVVNGVFNTLNGGSAAEGATTVLGGNTYALTYAYVGSGDSIANDVALVLIPEPATIALLSLGLFVIRRKK
jgi:hypothetical protein